jgi:hypothetical protein
MAEYQAGKGTTALGIIGTILGSLGVAGNNGLGGLFNTNNNCACHENTYVNRYEAQQSARIAELETEVKLRDANTFTMSEMGKLRDYVDGKFSTVEKAIGEQAVYNATNTATIGCIANQVNQLMALTKLVIPIASICPTPAVATSA